MKNCLVILILLMTSIFANTLVAGEKTASVYSRTGGYQGSIRTDKYGTMRIYNQRLQPTETWRKTGKNYYRYDSRGQYKGQVRQ